MKTINAFGKIEQGKVYIKTSCPLYQLTDWLKSLKLKKTYCHYLIRERDDIKKLIFVYSPPRGGLELHIEWCNKKM